MPISEKDFENLLTQSERADLDFKATPYNLSVEPSRADLIKDVLSMANTPREAPAHIILGVKKQPDGRTDLWGLQSFLDGADLQSQFRERVHPFPTFLMRCFLTRVNHLGSSSLIRRE